LVAMQGGPSKAEGAIGGAQDQHMELIGVLLELGVTDNPIWVWLLSRFDHLKSKIQTTSDRSKIEIEIFRRRLANGERPTTQIIASHLRSLSRQTAEDKPTSVDSSEIVELCCHRKVFSGRSSSFGRLCRASFKAKPRRICQ